MYVPHIINTRSFFVFVFRNVCVIISTASIETYITDIMAGKAKRKAVTIDEKREIIREHESGVRHTDICRKRGLKSSTLSSILKNKDAYLNADISQSTKRLRKPVREDVDRTLHEWFLKQSKANVRVTGVMLQAKAEEIARMLNDAEFRCSTGWLHRFKQRHNINAEKVRNETEGVMEVEATSLVETVLEEVRGQTRATSENREFREATKRDALEHLRNELDKLVNTAENGQKEWFRTNFQGFIELFERFLREEGPSIEWDKIQRLEEGSVLDYSELKMPTADVLHELLNKMVVIKLNGGLGTSMGCQGPKSVITVRNNLTFLDLTVQQIEHLNRTYKVNVPLVLMNSFNTDEDTEKIIRKYKNLNVKIYTFSQSCHPRINRDTLLPVAHDCNVKQHLDLWYPPGHGDFYTSFKNSGLLDKFVEEGKEYCFLSNIDNLGATVDLGILHMLLHPKDGLQREFVMEITDKTKADVKGGTLIRYENKLRLLEIAQVPKEHVEDFKSIKTFKYFNTNNLWIKLGAIQKIVDQNRLNMEIIVNNKSLENGTNVIQLETAVGAAMKGFENAMGINVPRSRFLPVKTTSDLLLVMSNLYELSHGSLVMSPQRMFPTTPLVKLGSGNFSKVNDFLARFPTIPDIIELDHLTISGDVTFGRKISFKGTVIIIANHGDRIDIPTGACLENKIVSGNLRILDH